MNTKERLPLSLAKAVLRDCLDAAKRHGMTWSDGLMDELMGVYRKHGLTEFPPSGRSYIYNQFTGHIDKKLVWAMKIGGKAGAYFGEKNGWCQVTTWPGQMLGRVTNASFYHKGGFAPVEAVSVTFEHAGKKYRGICAYKEMGAFTIKRVA